MPKLSNQNIIKGRGAVDAYRAAHAQLHSAKWHKGLPEEHTPLLNTMLSELKKQGFNSIDEFFKIEHQFVLTQGVLNLAGKEIRLIDMSAESYFDFLALIEAERNLMVSKQIPNTLTMFNPERYWITTGYNLEDSNEYVDLIKAKGLDVKLIINAPGKGTAIIGRGSVACVLTLKAGLQELTDAYAQRFFTEILRGLGITGTSLDGNDILVGGKKIIGMSNLNSETVSALRAIIALDFPYDLAHIIKSRADKIPAKDRVITARSILGKEVTTADLKRAFQIAVTTVFNTTLVIQTPSELELNLISKGRDRYISDE